MKTSPLRSPKQPRALSEVQDALGVLLQLLDVQGGPSSAKRLSRPRPRLPHSIEIPDDLGAPVVVQVRREIAAAGPHVQTDGRSSRPRPPASRSL